VGLRATKAIACTFFAQKYGTCEKLSYHSTFTNHELGKGNISILSYIILRANNKHIVLVLQLSSYFFFCIC